MENTLIYSIIAYVLIGILIAVTFSIKYGDFKLQRGSLFRMAVAVPLWPFVIIMELNDSSR